MTTTNTTSATLYLCDKCNGHGMLAEFSHIAGGVCFECRGTGRTTRKAPEARELPTIEDARCAFKALRHDVREYGYDANYNTAAIAFALAHLGRTDGALVRTVIEAVKALGGRSAGEVADSLCEYRIYRHFDAETRAYLLATAHPLPRQHTATPWAWVKMVRTPVDA